LTLSPPRSTLFPYTTLFRSHGTTQSGPARPVRPARVALGPRGNRALLRHPRSAPGREAGGCSLLDAGSVGLPARAVPAGCGVGRSEEHTSELQSRENLVCRL